MMDEADLEAAWQPFDDQWRLSRPNNRIGSAHVHTLPASKPAGFYRATLRAPAFRWLRNQERRRKAAFLSFAGLLPL
jgi:hypothetical protein